MSKISVCDMCGKTLSDITIIRTEGELRSKMRWDVKITPFGFGMTKEYDFCESCFDKIRNYIKENKNGK